MILPLLLTSLFALGVSSSYDHTPNEQNIIATDNIAEQTSNDTTLLKSTCFYKLEYSYVTGSPVSSLPYNLILFAESFFVSCSSYERRPRQPGLYENQLEYILGHWMLYFNDYLYDIFYTHSFTLYFRPTVNTTFNNTTFSTITEVRRTKGIYYLNTTDYYTTDYLDFSTFIVNPITSESSICIWGYANPIFDESTFLMYGIDNKLFPRNETTYETSHKIKYYDPVCFFESSSSPYNTLRPSFYVNNEYGLVPTALSYVYCLKYSCFEVLTSFNFNNLYQAYIFDKLFTADYNGNHFKKLNNGWWYFNLSRFSVASYNGFNFLGSFTCNNNTYNSLYFDISTIDNMDLYFTYYNYVQNAGQYHYELVNTNLIHNSGTTWTTFDPRTFNCICYFTYDIVPVDAYNNFMDFASPQFVADDPSTTDFADLFFALADTPIYYLMQLFSFDLFGINVYIAFTSLMALLIIFWVIRKII